MQKALRFQHGLANPASDITKIDFPEYRQSSLDMVRRTFTDYENAEEAQIVVSLIEEIRSMDTYVPELEHISGVVAYTDYRNLT